MNTLDRCRVGTSPAARRMDAAAEAHRRQAAAQREVAEGAARARGARAWAEEQVARWAKLQPHIVVVKAKPAWVRIAEEVAALHGISIDDLTGQSRLQIYVVPRQEAMYRIYDETPLSTPEIGRRFGGRDHTSVLHAVRVHAERAGVPLPRQDDGEPS